VIRVDHAAGNVIETHEHAGEFKGWRASSKTKAITLLNVMADLLNMAA